MNRVFRLLWSHSLQAMIPVPEGMGGGGGSRRGSRRNLRRRAGSLSAFILVLGGGTAWAVDPAVNALPTGGQIVSGAGSINQSGNTLTVNQSTGQMIANWSSFNIGSGSTVNFVQPSTSSVALNRVAGGVSQIFGALNANGQVILINPNGIVFGPSSQVNVGGVVASSLGMSDADFLAGRNVFTGGNGAGSVVNQGTISADKGGVIALIAPQVTNQGTLSAPGGSIALAAGNGVTLDFVGDGLIRLNVDQAAFNALVANHGAVIADGGMVAMSARSANALMDTVINSDGIVQANSVTERNGRIILDGGNTGTVQVSGSVNATGAQAGQTGGTIAVTGNQVNVGANAVIDASGAAGGGTVEIGGGKQGQDTSLKNAQGVNVDSTATIRANATDKGNGGTAIVWSDGVTSVGGTIIAAGGPNGGNGGYVETSGHTLNLAPNIVVRPGKGGTWLLDPANSTVDATVAASYVSTLNTGADVIDQVSGNIAITADIIASGTGNLSFQASGHITVTSANIELAGGNLYLGGYNGGATAATGSTSGDVGITLTNTTLSTTGSGSITVIGTGYIPTDYSVNSPGSTVSYNANAGIGVRMAGNVTFIADTITVTGQGGHGQNVTNTAGDGTVTLPHTGNNGGLTGSKAVANDGAVGVQVDNGAVVTVTATTSATIKGTGGAGGNATASSIGGQSQAGDGAKGYYQLGSVTFTAPTATINGVKGNAGSASSNYNTEYSYTGGCASYDVNNNCISYQTLWNTTGHGGSSGDDGFYGIYTSGDIANLAAGSTLKLLSTGDAYQSAGTLTAPNVLMQGYNGAYTFTFEQATNNIDVLAAQANTLYYRDTQDLLLGTVGGVSGVTTGNAAYIRVDSKSAAKAAALIQDSGATPLSFGNVGILTADTMQFNGNANNVTGTSVGLRTVTASQNIVITATDLNAGNDLFLDTAKLGVFSSSIGKLIIGGSTNTGLMTIGNATFNPTTTLQAGSGNIALQGNLTEGSSGNGTLTLSSSGVVSYDGTYAGTGAVNGAGAVTGTSTGKITTGNLILDGTGGAGGAATGKFLLTNAANSVTNLAANVDTVELTDTHDLTLTQQGANTISGGVNWDSTPFSNQTISGVNAVSRAYIKTSGNLTVANTSPNFISVSANGTYTTTNSTNPTNLNDRMGAALLLVAGGYYNDNYSSSVLSAGNSRFLVYSSTPVTGGSSRHNQAYAFKAYAWNFYANSTYNYDLGSFGRILPTTGNGFLYTVQPTITVTPGTATSVYGNTPSLSGLTYSTAGYIDGDSSEQFSGTAAFNTTATSASAVGAYNIAYASGLTMANGNGLNMGYAVVDATAHTGEYSITARPITITADSNQSYIYGSNDDTSLTYRVTSGSLVNTGVNGNGNLSGWLSHVGGPNAGTYAITQGTLNNSNYTITFVPNVNFTINQRPITIIPKLNQSKVAGQVNDPTLVYQVVYTGDPSKTPLAGSDFLIGLLSRMSGESVGKYDITRGTLSVSDHNEGGNYAITLTPATFAVVNPIDTSSLTSVQTGITGTSTNSGGGTTQTTATASPTTPTVGAGSGSATMLAASNTQVVVNHVDAPQNVPTGGASSMTLSSAAGGQALSVSNSGGSVSVTIGGNSANAADASKNGQTALTLYTAKGGSVESQGSFVVVQKGQTLSASAGGQSAAAPSANQVLIAPAATGSIDLPGGDSVPMSVGISKEGVLMISLPPGAESKVDPQTIMLIGMAMAQKNFGSAVDSVKSVVLTPAQ